MRQIQRQSREREIESQKPVKALWKSEKYKDVQSKIKSDFEVCTDVCIIMPVLLHHCITFCITTDLEPHHFYYCSQGLIFNTGHAELKYIDIIMDTFVKKWPVKAVI